jgi:hypothetical protein
MMELRYSPNEIEETFSVGNDWYDRTSIGRFDKKPPKWTVFNDTTGEMDSVSDELYPELESAFQDWIKKNTRADCDEKK